MLLPDSKLMTMQFADEIREAAILGALALKAIDGDKDDNISENVAYERYGKAWVVKRVREGQIRFRRIGSGKTSTKVYSVFEIVTLIRAEKHLTQVYNNALIEQENRKRNGNERDL